MNKKEKCVLKHNHALLVENLEPIEIRPFLIDNGVISDIKYLDDEPIREHRVEKLLKYVKDNCSFKLFLEALQYEDSYSFLAETLRDGIVNPPEPTKLNLYCMRRIRSMKLRYKLKQCIIQGDSESFYALYNPAIDNWESIPLFLRHKRRPEERQELADMYFMAIDAEIERCQLCLFETKLHESELFKKLTKIASHTTNPSLTSIVYLARYGEALLTGGIEPSDAMSYVSQAEEVIKECKIPKCRESGIVLCTKFHIEYHINELHRLSLDKSRLISLAKEAIDHFQQEAESIGDDFERTMLIEIALVYLGMGLYLNYVEESVSKVDVDQAESILQNITKECNLNNLELRTRMICYSLKSRLSQLRNNEEEAIEFAKNSLHLAIEGKFQRDIKNIENNIKILSQRKVTIVYDKEKDVT